jgi:hypothetical protein
MSNLSDFFGAPKASLIDEVVFLNNDADVLTTDDGRVYLKGGVYETDLTVYPDANTEVVNGGNNFSFADQTTTCEDICSDGTHLYLVENTNDKVYKYTKAGVYVAQYDISGSTTTPHAIEWDGTSFWIGDDSERVRQYDTSFNLIGSYTDLTAQLGSNGIRGIAWDGTHFYVLDYNRYIWKYNSSWVYQNVTWHASGTQGYNNSLLSDGTYIYIIYGHSQYQMNRYTSSGASSAVPNFSYYSLYGLGTKILGTWDGDYFRFVKATGTVYQWQPANGIKSVAYTTNPGSQGSYAQHGEGQNYVRVK